MNEELVQQMMAGAEKLAAAAAALERAVGQLDAQHQLLSAKVDRIVAAIEDRGSTGEQPGDELKRRVTELERTNAELKEQTTRLSRKTLPPLVSSLLSKYSETSERMDAATLDKTLSALSVEQRIAVKSEMARAGMLE